MPRIRIDVAVDRTDYAAIRHHLGLSVTTSDRQAREHLRRAFESVVEHLLTDLRSELEDHKGKE